MVRKNQEKLRKMTKVRKNFLLKLQILSAQIYQILYVQKPLIGKKIT